MLIYDTRKLPQKYQHDYWQDAISHVFVPLNCEISSKSKFFGALESKKWENWGVVSVEGSAQRVERTIKNIKQNDDDSILMSLVISGQVELLQNNREVTLKQGEFAFYDTLKPYDLYLNENFNQLTVILPRTMFQKRFGKIDLLTAHGFGSKHPLKDLNLTFANSLIKLSESLSIENQDQLLIQYMDLLGLIINMDHHKPNGIILFQIKNFILLNIENPSLNIEYTASNFKISTRYISKLFQNEETTFGRFLLESHLNYARKILKKSVKNHRSISEIGYLSGFQDMAYFSREFKRFFGISPKEFKNNISEI